MLWTGAVKKPGTKKQYAALPWRYAGSGREVLLISSRDTGRWVIPKGWPISDLDPSASAAREAWEEAGVRGKTETEPMGLYSYDKVLGPDSVACTSKHFPGGGPQLDGRPPGDRRRARGTRAVDRAARSGGIP